MGGELIDLGSRLKKPSVFVRFLESKLDTFCPAGRLENDWPEADLW
jgi:hypothetical protein